MIVVTITAWLLILAALIVFVHIAAGDDIDPELGVFNVLQPPNYELQSLYEPPLYDPVSEAEHILSEAGQ